MLDKLKEVVRRHRYVKASQSTKVRDCQEERVVEPPSFYADLQGGRFRTFKVDTRLVDDFTIQIDPQ